METGVSAGSQLGRLCFGVLQSTHGVYVEEFQGCTNPGQVERERNF